MMNVDILKYLPHQSKPIDQFLLKKYLARSSKNKKPYSSNLKKKAKKRAKTLNEPFSIANQPVTSTPRIPDKSVTPPSSENKALNRSSSSSSSSKPSLNSRSKLSKSTTSTPIKTQSKAPALSTPSPSKPPSYNSSFAPKVSAHSSRSSISNLSITPKSTSSYSSPKKSTLAPQLSSSKSLVKPRKLFAPVPKIPKTDILSVSNKTSEKNDDLPNILSSTFKIPKKPKLKSEQLISNKSDENSEPATENTTNEKPNESSNNLPDESMNVEEDFDDLDIVDPLLELYESSEPLTCGNSPTIDDDNCQSQEIPNTAKVAPAVESAVVEEEIEQHDESMEEELAMDQDTLPVFLPTSSLYMFDNDSESSDDEGNFKRKGAKDRDDSIIKEPQVQPRVNTPIRSNLPKPNVSSSESSVKSRLQQPIHSPSSTVRYGPASSVRTQVQRFPDEPPIEEILAVFNETKNSDEAMKKFLEIQNQYPKSFFLFRQDFQALFKQILLKLFCDPYCYFSPPRVNLIISQLSKLEMNDDIHWEEFICTWGEKYPSLTENLDKKMNIKNTMNVIYEYLQSESILINLSTAKYLFEMREGHLIISERLRH